MGDGIDRSKLLKRVAQKNRGKTSGISKRARASLPVLSTGHQGDRSSSRREAKIGHPDGHDPGQQVHMENQSHRSNMSVNPADADSVGFQATSTDEEAINSSRSRSRKGKSPIQPSKEKRKA
ncbi:hypothetical protein TanjilG_19706 [Lupinus angustifolius]|uniref:Uncharacterized protein n=1 Tax=Lupinus angustifolius TaxID=3871 RepID=A0A4P1RAD8_LUPAN|nr:hypothetical protein TanjilG_19706 [Lupinus angustifolius]